jgi:hypothetical protein
MRRCMPFQVSLGYEVLTSHTLLTPASVDHVWGVLADGWLFTQWAVGASQVCEVASDWPAAGSRLHHAVGRGRLAFKCETRVLASTSGRLLKLRADGWPSGGSEMTVTLEPVGAATVLRIDELAAAGPGHVLPASTHNMLLKWRNTEALRRLSCLAEDRQS